MAAYTNLASYLQFHKSKIELIAVESSVFPARPLFLTFIECYQETGHIGQFQALCS